MKKSTINLINILKGNNKIINRLFLPKIFLYFIILQRQSNKTIQINK